MMLDTNKVVSIVLGGGEGKRLFPLTKFRCKPSIPFGQFKLIDIPLSHCLHASVRKIFVITQFLSYSLHRHLLHTYRLDTFSKSFIEVLAPEQRPDKGSWYEGTADAVRQNIDYLIDTNAEYFLILSGDQIYNMDFREILSFAMQKGADLTIASIPIHKKDATRMGLLKADCNFQVLDFIEKPASEKLMKPFVADNSLLNQIGLAPSKSESYLASMGIYIFKRRALFDLLREEKGEDFGHHLIPLMVKRKKAATYIYNGYWEDIGTIESFYQASLSLLTKSPKFNCYDEKRSIFTFHDHLPGPKIVKCKVDGAIISNGSIVEGKEVKNTILGPRSVISKNCSIKDSIIFGNDFYEPSQCDYQRFPGKLMIDEDCVIKKAILDKNVYLGKGVKLINKDKLKHYDGPSVFIRDGIIIVPEGAVLPDGYVL